MNDKSLHILLMALFGVGGMTILIFAWVQPMSAAERVLTTFIGSFGLLWVVVRVLIFDKLLGWLSLEKIWPKLGLKRSYFNRH